MKPTDLINSLDLRQSYQSPCVGLGERPSISKRLDVNKPGKYSQVSIWLSKDICDLTTIEFLTYYALGLIKRYHSTDRLDDFVYYLKEQIKDEES